MIGEETFIPLDHIIVMEFAGELLEIVDDGMDKDEEENDEQEDWLSGKLGENDELDNWLNDKLKEDEL